MLDIMGIDNECGSCDRYFPSGRRARDQHVNDTGHRFPPAPFECETCYDTFCHDEDRFTHMDQENHFQRECSMCSRTFPNDSSRAQHEHDAHHYCGDCKRGFRNANNLSMHLHSGKHRGSGISCPFCNRGFANATGLTHHIERGSCPHATGISRDKLYKLVRSKDPSNIITKKLIGWHSSTEYEANNLSYNPNRQGWECYLCHRLFNFRRGLDQHLNSPAHQQSLYHCPNRNCAKEFKTLAAIINHLESESCGCTRFETVQRSIHNVMSGDRLISF